MTGRNARQNVIVASGNYALYTSGQNVFSSNGEPLVAPGQLVVYNPKTLKSLGAGITVATNPEIVIGVGIDTNGDGVSDTIRANFGDKLYGYQITAASAEGPACGVSPIKDFFFDCTHYSDEFTIAVTIENQQSRTEMAYNKPFTYVVHIKVDKQPCDTCDTGVSCKVVSCKIVDAFRGVNGSTSVLKREKFTSNAIKRLWDNAGFEVVNLWGGDTLGTDTTFKFCVDTVAGDCDNCIDTDFLFTTFSFTEPGEETATEFTFTNVSNVGGTATLTAQLNRVIAQINAALDGNGYAVLTKGIGKCCPYTIEVNTCFADFAIEGLTPCETSNPFDFTYVQELACKNCEVTSEKTPPKCGIRVIAKPQDYDCGHYPTTQPIVNFMQEIDIYPLSGFKEGQTYVKEVQAGANPRNLGYHWQYIDYVSDNGGLGRTHNEYNDQYGSLGLPGRNDRVNSTMIKCPAQYCSYDIHHNLPYDSSDVHGYKKYTNGLTSVIVPTGDSTTKTAFEAIINPYLASAPNPKIATITCGSDQDQDNGTYPDYNGNRDI